MEALFEGLRDKAISTYHVDPIVFIILYVLTVPVYYYGQYLMVRTGYHYYKKEYRGKKKFRLDVLVTYPGFLRGFIVNRLGWVIPYFYVIIFGRNLSLWFYLVILFWLGLTTFIYLKKSHKDILMKDITYKVANKEEQGEALNLVSKRYFEAGYLKKGQSQKPYHDEYVRYSKYFVAKCEDEIVGVIRVVQNSNVGIPTLNDFEVWDEKVKRIAREYPKKVVELGNLAANPGHRVSRGLYRTVIKYCVDNNYLVVASIDQNLFNYFLLKYWMLKPFYRQIGRAKYYVGSVSVPVEIKPNKLMLLFL